MVQHLEMLPTMPNRPGCAGQMVQLLIQCFSVVRENIGATAVYWDHSATGGVCCGEPRFTLRLLSSSLLPTGNGIRNFGHE